VVPLGEGWGVSDEPALVTGLLLRENVQVTMPALVTATVTLPFFCVE
jgi:pantoate kinase